jgi:SAM-dependent methyltransferase
MRSAILSQIIAQIPDDTFAPNVIVSGALARGRVRICNLPVPHEARRTGSGSLGDLRIWRVALKALRQTLLCRPRLSARRVEGRRLVYYGRSPDADFWAEQWERHPSSARYAWAEQGGLGPLEGITERYLPRGSRVVEAGCGLGQHVVALRVRGYAVEGVEWAQATVQAVLARYPDLPIRQGDVTSLAVPDGYYRGYVSLGVVEHRGEGPEPFLREAYRVLADDGVAFISVPWFHGLRRLKAMIGLCRQNPGGLAFYEYAFTVPEFTAILGTCGFRVLEVTAYGGFKGVTDEVGLLRAVMRWRGAGWRLHNWLQDSPWVSRRLGHMALFVCRKEYRR